MSFRIKIGVCLLGLLLLALGSHFLVPLFSEDNALDKLYETLRNKEATEQSIEGFFKYGPKAGDYLIRKIRTEKDVNVKIQAINLIGGLGCNSCEEELSYLLVDPDHRVRIITIDALFLVKYAKLSDLMRDIVLNDEDERVKVWAIVTLGRIGKKEDVAFLKSISQLKGFKKENLSKAIAKAIGTSK